MSADPSEQQWLKLAEAARRAGPQSEVDPVPDREQIRQRFHGMKDTLRELLLLGLWKRWALLAVVLAVLAYVLVFFLIGRGPSTAPEPPVISIPAPP